jgi:hypothetical protein
MMTSKPGCIRAAPNSWKQLPFLLAVELVLHSTFDTLTETTDCNEVLILFRIMRAAADSVRVWTANDDQQTTRVPSQSMYA